MTVFNLADHPRFRAERNLITRKQLMEKWQIKSVTTIKKYEKMGLPVTRLPGGSPRYDVLACEEWLQGSAR